MKPTSMLKVAAFAAVFALAACGTQKKAVKDTAAKAPVTSAQQQDFLQKVKDNAQNSKFITSKVKFKVEVGSQSLSLTGNLKMKRDDVVRLQLTAFGFVEAGRLEFTKDYVLIMDRINKQYIKATYNQLDFMRNSGLNFYSLQALFWNELFQPDKTHLVAEDMNNFKTDLYGEDAIVTFSKDKLSYRWLADKNLASLKMVNVLYEDRIHGNYQLNWDYSDFKTAGNTPFPHSHKILFRTPDKEVKLGMTLNYLGHEDDWETRTQVSSKYREVTVDQILRRFMAL